MITLVNKYKQVLLYIFFACITSLINIVTFWFSNLIITNLIICNIIAYTVSITSSFFINKKKVFRKNDGKTGKQFSQYLVVKAVAFIIDSLILLLLHDYFGMKKMFAKILSNMSTTLSNYTLNNKWVFKKSES